MPGMKSQYIKKFKRKKLLRAAAAVALLAVFVYAVFYIKNFQTSANRNRSELIRLWKSAAYAETFQLAGTHLEAAPMEFFFLTLRGFSAYQLAFAQINRGEMTRYVDECIFALRKAVLTKQGAKDGRVFYVLGKAYYFKGGEYAELCVENLEKAREYAKDAAANNAAINNAAAKNADDLYEYLGLAYAELGDYEKSVEAFAHTLDRPGETPADSLLLAIARSYIALGEYETAGLYLNQCLSATRDIDAAVAARILLGGVLREQAEYRAAEKQYLAVLEEAGEIAAAHFELGELYLAEGNTALARSEWRKANRIDPAYAPAINRLNNRSGS